MGGRGRWTRGGRGRTEHNRGGGDGGHRERCRVCYTRWHCSNPHPRRQQGSTTEMVDARRGALCGPGQIPRTSVSPSCTRYCFIFAPTPHHHFAIPSLLTMITKIKSILSLSGALFMSIGIISSCIHYRTSRSSGAGIGPQHLATPGALQPLFWYRREQLNSLPFYQFHLTWSWLSTEVSC